jgi:hypothetical protein
MYLKITGKTDAPEFIPPTPANNQEYIVYMGGDFNVNVYALASSGRYFVFLLFAKFFAVGITVIILCSWNYGHFFCKTCNFKIS